MSKKDLHTQFEEAVAFMNAYTNPLPADTILQLYAYYKIATENSAGPNSKTPLINAFKANALIQAQNIDISEAKQLYVELVDEQFRNKK